jgi:vacuolar protein sorting-associated protein 13A/C
MAVSIGNLGMSLLQMGKETDSVRFLDDVDMTLSMVNRTEVAQSMMSIEISSKPIVFRASYRDINLILAIANRAIALSSPPQAPSTQKNALLSLPSSDVATTSAKRTFIVKPAQVVMTKEQVPAFCVITAAFTQRPVSSLPTSKDSASSLLQTPLNNRSSIFVSSHSS